jgi:hypothetical protein
MQRCSMQTSKRQCPTAITNAVDIAYATIAATTLAPTEEMLNQQVFVMDSEFSSLAGVLEIFRITWNEQAVIGFLQI